MTATTPTSSSVRVPLTRAAATGAATLGVIYVACWIGTQFAGLTVSHMYLALFTREPIESTAALIQGFGWSLVFGAFSAVLLAFFNNLFASFGRR